MQDLSQVFDQATVLYRKGDLAAAESLFLQLLEAQPDHADVLQMLGFLRYQQGRFLEALSSIGAALKTNPDSPNALLNYAVVLDALQRREEALAIYDKALAIKPDYAEALFNRGIALRDLKRPAEALASFDKMLALQPNDPDALNHRGNALRSLNRPAEAIASFDKALAINPRDADVLNNRGNALRDLDRTAEALASYDKAVAIKPDYVEALNNRGSALRSLKRPAEALASYDRALAIKPNDAGALYNRGNALQDLKRPADALASFDQALAIKPNYAEAWLARGNVFRHLKRHDEAFAAYDKALALKPDFAEAWLARGGVLCHLKRHDEAFAAYDKAMAFKPDFAEAWHARGSLFCHLSRYDEAFAAYDKALALKPDFAGAWCGRGNVLLLLERYDEAVAFYDKALAIDPDLVGAWQGRATVLLELMRYDEAAAAYDKAIGIEPELEYAKGLRLHARQHACDWRNFEHECSTLISAVRRGERAAEPFVILAIPSTPSDQLKCAQLYVADKCTAEPDAHRRGKPYFHDRIRVAYLSGDFRRHPVGHLLAGLFELHDRARFEIIGISLRPDDGSEVGARLVRSFDQFYDMSSKTDRETVELLRGLEADIVVDLTGHTTYARLGILAGRPAPIQVSYLGFLGTMGADFIDYVIADKIALPFEQQPFYTERIVHLPDCFLVNDRKLAISPRVPSRSEAGLPEDGFVFCSFNNMYKIQRPIFEVWMRLLRRVEGSVLWLFKGNEIMVANLRRAAETSGVAASRLVFAPFLDLPDHLARQRLADLVLDTVPYNAGATGGGTLWAGVPMLTCAGETFVGRMAASMLHAVGLPELVTRSLDEYEASAIELAGNPEMLQSLRRKLAGNRLTHPLFDTDRFRRHIEAAYLQIWERHLKGQSPDSFAVAPID